MHNGFLKKATALMLALILMLSLCLSLTSCFGSGDDGSDNADGGSSSTQGSSDSASGSNADYHDKIISVPYKDFGRNTVDFSDIVYSRPDFNSVNKIFSDIISAIESNQLSFEEQLSMIRNAEGPYHDVITMRALTNVNNAIDSSSQFWNDELTHISSNYPDFAEIIEDMFVAAANSPHAEQFEYEYFGEGLIEEYKDGGKYNDKAISLWKTEETLEAEYSSISTASITVTYGEITNTVDKILGFYRDKYGENSQHYAKAYIACMTEYKKKNNEKCLEIFIELLKVRAKLADALGYESYAEYGYEVLGRDYSVSYTEKILDGITEYVVPVYRELSSSVFGPFFNSESAHELSLDVLINNTYSAILKADQNLGEIYQYMLQHELFDIELSSTNRSAGAFSTYFNSYNAPFIFMSAGGNVNDYCTLIHEFGHFADYYVNNNSSASIDQKEISSQGLEYLTLTMLDGILSSKELQYLTYSKTREALETLIFQGFYTRLEHLIYELDENQITHEKLNEKVVLASKEFGLNTSYVNDISVAFIPHIFQYPFYVQSYCISLIPSLEMYFMEIENEGSGLEAYKRLLDRSNDKGKTLAESIEAARLGSPFEKNALKKIADNIYYYTIGSHYYDTEDGGVRNENAA